MYLAGAIALLIKHLPYKREDQSSSSRTEEKSCTWGCECVILALDQGRQTEPWHPPGQQTPGLRTQGGWFLRTCMHICTHTRNTRQMAPDDLYTHMCPQTTGEGERVQGIKKTPLKVGSGLQLFTSCKAGRASFDFSLLMSGYATSVPQRGPCQFSVVAIFLVHRKSEGIRPGGLPRSCWQSALHSSLFFLYSCFYAQGGRGLLCPP